MLLVKLRASVSSAPGVVVVVVVVVVLFSASAGANLTLVLALVGSDVELERLDLDFAPLQGWNRVQVLLQFLCTLNFCIRQ